MNKYNATIAAVVIATMLLSTIILAAPTLSLNSIRLPQIFNTAFAQPDTNEVVLEAEVLPNGQYAYRMVSHQINGDDLTGMYNDDDIATIPGPTIVINEGEALDINVINSISGIDADVVVEGFNFNSAKTGTYIYKGEEGALLGLFGAIIVNDDDGSVESYVDGADGEITDAELSDLDKEFVVFMVGSTFWGQELETDDGQTPLWTNPTISAIEGDLVRFHILSVGPGHTFHQHAHRWVDPGTSAIIDTKLMEDGQDTHVFTIIAGDSVGPGDWQYHCHVFAHMEAGMHGIFRVVPSDESAANLAGASPYNIHPFLADLLGVDAPSGPGLVTFEISDEPGSWFRNTLDISGVTVTKSLALANPGDSAHFIMSDTDTVHTITSLLWPTGAPHMPMDEVQSYKGGGIVPLHDPGLYVFTCKIHPYMFGGVIVDDPDTQIELDEEGNIVPGTILPELLGNIVTEDGGLLLDLGDEITLVNGLAVPTGSDLALRLAKTFFVATAPPNWRDYTEAEWDPSYPPVPVQANVAGVGPVAVQNLDTLLDVYFAEGTANELLDPLEEHGIQGVGEVWVDTQFEKTDDKTKPGTATAVDTTTWEVSKKVALPDYNMNNPHNMWTDADQTVIYQTEWFSNKLSTFDRETGTPLSQIVVGEAPSHVMTRADTDDIHVALNGEEGVAEILATTEPEEVDRIIAMQGYGQNPTHPHAHWMSHDGKKMVTPNSFTHDSTLYGFEDEEIIGKDATGVLAIATGMTPDSEFYTVANLLGLTISVMDMDDGSKVRDLVPVADYNPIPLNGITGSIASDADGDGKIIIAALAIQTPISPDGKYMVTANTLTGNILITDVSDPDPDNWFFVKTLDCDPGCHGVQFGAKEGGGYLAYASTKFANDLIVIDIDEDSPTHLEIVGRILLNTGDETEVDDIVTDLEGMGGQGVLPVPVVYNGWVQNLPEEWTELLTCEQRTPIDEDAIASCEAEEVP